jgi:hypothetical protein
MSQLSRRQFFKVSLEGLLETAGTVVLASVVLPARGEASEIRNITDSGNDLEQRANQLAELQLPGPESREYCLFRNAAFRNAGGAGGFRNGGFANAGFRNAGFANGAYRSPGTPVPGYQNGRFNNGGWRNY